MINMSLGVPALAGPAMGIAAATANAAASAVPLIILFIGFSLFVRNFCLIWQHFGACIVRLERLAGKGVSSMTDELFFRLFGPQR
jgi:hypothetical protein